MHFQARKRKGDRITQDHSRPGRAGRPAPSPSGRAVQLGLYFDDSDPALGQPFQALANESAEAHQIRLLLIEDNPGDVRLVQEILHYAPDIKVYVVNRLSQGIAYLAVHETDVVLLDLGLPDSRGLDTLRTLAGWAPNVPIVVFTGQGDDETGKSMLERISYHEAWIPKRKERLM